MPTPQHNRNKNQLTPLMPTPTKRVRLIRQPGTNPYTSISRHNFKRDIKDRLRDRITIKIRDFDYTYEEDGQNKPPQIMS
jgi:hypothetical protein